MHIPVFDEGVAAISISHREDGERTVTVHTRDDEVSVVVGDDSEVGIKVSAGVISDPRTAYPTIRQVRLQTHEEHEIDNHDHE